jgi:hypothetical protein
MEIAAILLGLAAVGGLTMVLIRLRGVPLPPFWLAGVHGIVGVAGLALLIGNLVAQPAQQLALIATVGFVLAAVGGMGMFLMFHLRRKELPLAFMLGHGTLAIISFVLLLVSLSYRSPGQP